MFSVRGMGGGGEGEHVGGLAHLLELLLLGHAEALLLVDDDQPQVVELHVFAHQPWVPTTMSMLPRFTFRRIWSCCLEVRNRESSSTSTGKPSMRFKMVW